MKTITTALIATLWLLQGAALFAQYLPKSVAPYKIEISYDKTSNLIFPSSIKSVDRGNTAILAQKAPGVENILQLKAGEQNFKESNVTVITADGHFYSFVVNYVAVPAVLNFSFVGDSTEKAMIKNQLPGEASFLATANVIKSRRHSLHKHVWEQNIKLSVNNIFVRNDIMWLQIGLKNKSLIVFSPAYVRFFLQDCKTPKRTATQQSEIVPLYKTPLDKVDNRFTKSYAFAFTPFTIPAAKELVVQVGEGDGNRLLTLHISHRIIRKIKSL